MNFEHVWEAYVSAFWLFLLVWRSICVINSILQKPFVNSTVFINTDNYSSTWIYLLPSMFWSLFSNMSELVCVHLQPKFQQKSPSLSSLELEPYYLGPILLQLNHLALEVYSLTDFSLFFVSFQLIRISLKRPLLTWLNV